MTEKSSVFQTVQIGVETTPGVAVAADKKLVAVSLLPAVKSEADSFKPLGMKYPSFVTLNKEWSEAKVEGKLTYNEILYLLASLLSEPTPAQQGVTAAYLWTFVSNSSGSDEGISLTVEQGDASTAWKAAGVRINGLELKFSREEVSLGGSAIGGPLTTGIALTEDPDSLTPKPVLPAQVKLYMASTQAGLAAASAVDRGFSIEWNLTDKFQLAWPIGQDPIIVETSPKLESKLQLATDSVGLGLIDSMRSGTTLWFRIKAIGETIASTYKHTFQLDFPAQVKEVGEFSDEDGLYMAEFTLEGIHDSDWGKAFQIDVTTDVSTL